MSKSNATLEAVNATLLPTLWSDLKRGDVIQGPKGDRHTVVSVAKSWSGGGSIYVEERPAQMPLGCRHDYMVDVVIMPVCGGSPEAAEVEAPVKAKRTRKPKAENPSDALIMATLEDSRNHYRPTPYTDACEAWDRFSIEEGRAISRRLTTFGFDKAKPSETPSARFARFVAACHNGSPVSFPEPVAQVEAPVEAARVVFDVVQKVKPGTNASYTPGEWLEATFRTIEEAYEFCSRCNQFALVDGISYHVVATEEENPGRPMSHADHVRERSKESHRTEIPPVSGGAPTPLVGEPVTTPLVGDAVTTRKMTASDYDVNLDDIRKEGWDVRYFGIAQRAIRDGALEVLASSDYGCSVHGPGLDTYGDTDDDEQADFLAWLRIIRSPIRLTARNFSQAWDEFIVDCREGTPVGFPVTPLPDGDLDAMRSIFEETCQCG